MPLKPIAKILAYVGVVVCGGALLAPPLYWLGQWVVRADVLPALRPFGFEKYFNRAILLWALAGLWPFMRALGLRRWGDLRLQPNPRRWRHLLGGALLAVGGFALVAAALLGTHHLEVRGSPTAVDVGAALLTAGFVAVVEETLFRGALLGVLRRSLPWVHALFFLSVFFAVLHFIKPDPAHQRITDVGWGSGFALLPHVFWQFGEPRLVLGTLVTLVAMGWTLGYTVVRTGSLYLAIGMHAGWVFGLKVLASCTNRLGSPSIWVGDDLRSGLVPTSLMLVTFATVFFLLRDRSTVPANA